MNRKQRRDQMRNARGRVKATKDASLEWLAAVLAPIPARRPLAAAMLQYLNEADPQYAPENSCAQACEMIHEYLKHADQRSTIVPVTLTVVDKMTDRVRAKVGADPARVSGTSWFGHVVLAVPELGVLDPTAGQVNLIDPQRPHRPMSLRSGVSQLLQGGSIASDFDLLPYGYIYAPAAVYSSYRDVPTVAEGLEENARLIASDRVGYERAVTLIDKLASVTSTTGLSENER